MTLVPIDIAIVVKYDFTTPENCCIYTNARTDNDALEELINTWVQDQIGRGGDNSPRAEREVYTIKIGFVFEDESFATESDTGNKGLTVGIMMAVLRLVMDKKIVLKTLKELPPEVPCADAAL